jgi:cystathionine beta-lyase/cystathionine gamma-synthase
MDVLPAGSHIIASDDLYGGTFRLLDKVKKITANTEISFVDMTKLDEITKNIKPNTKMIWVETPTNPLLKLADLAAIVKLVEGKNIIKVADNTFASPYIQKPLDLGFDVVVHSATKYINGHSDIVGGVVVVGKNKELSERIGFLQNSIGSIAGPFDSFLAHRGLKTLGIRMERHSSNAMKVAEYLEKHSKIAKVIYPGLKSHPQHDIAKKQMAAFGGMITAILKGGIEDARKMLEKCKIFTLAESLGGIESLIEHPAIMTHASIPAEQRKAVGIEDGLIRLSVGIEDIEDLIADLEQALI